MAYRIQKRRDYRANWETINPTLLEGEEGFVLDDPNLFKIGDGIHTWNELPYRGYTGTIAQTLGNNENAVASQKVVTEKFAEQDEKLSDIGSEVIDISLIKSEKCSLGIEGWFYDENLGCSHKAIDLRLGYNNIKFKSDKNSIVGFVTNSYSTPYNNNDAIPYVNGTSRILVEANTLTVLDIPKDAAYFILTTVDGGGNLISYSDIELSAKYVMRQVSELKKDVSEAVINLADLNNESGALGYESWFYYKNLGCSHKAIDLTLGYEKVSITSNKFTYVGFLTDSYSPPYVNGDSVPYVEGTSRIDIKANTPTTLEVPSGAAYLILTTVDGGGNAIEYPKVALFSKHIMQQVENLKTDLSKKKKEQDELKTNISDLRNELTDFENDVRESNVDISILRNQNCSLGSEGWYYYKNLGCSHKAIDLRLGYDKVVITANRFAYIGFLTDSYSPPYSNGDSIPYANNSTRLSVEANTPTTINIPLDAAYLVLTTVDGGGNIVEYSEVKVFSKKVMQNVCELNKKINKVKDELEDVGIIDMEIDIEISKLTNQKCSLGVGNWFYYSSLGCSHKAVKIEKGYESFVIAAKQTASIGFVTDSYNPPYANNDTIPYVDGTERIMIDANTPTTLDIPNDAAYLILTTVDGGGTLIEYSNVTVKAKSLIQDQVDKNTKDITRLYETISDIEKETNPSLKGIFSIMTYNIGSWYNGTGNPIPIEEKETYLPLQEKIMQMYNSDVVLIQEFNNEVVVNGLTSLNFLNRYHLAVADVNGDTWYDGKAIASKYQITNVEVVPFVTKDTHHTCFIKGNIFCNGRKVTIVSVHFVIGESLSSLQLDELLENVKNEEYLIIGMDSNIDIQTESGKSIFKKVTNAGLKYLNEGIVTAPKQGLAIDNIIVTPNIVVKSVYADTTKSILGDNADHYPLLAYLEIY